MKWQHYGILFPCSETYLDKRYNFAFVDVWVQITKGKYAGSIGHLSIPTETSSMYDQYGALLPTRTHILVGTKKVPLTISQGSIWTSCLVAFVPKGNKSITPVYKAAETKKPKIPKIFDHFGVEILPGSTVLVTRSGRTEFGSVTKILHSGSFRYKGIRTRSYSKYDLEPSEDSCYTMCSADVVVVDEGLFDRVLIGKLSS